MRFLRFTENNVAAFLTVAAALHAAGQLDDSRGIVSGIDNGGPWMAITETAVVSAVVAVAREAGADAAVVRYDPMIDGPDPITAALSGMLAG